MKFQKSHNKLILTGHVHVLCHSITQRLTLMPYHKWICLKVYCINIRVILSICIMLRKDDMCGCNWLDKEINCMTKLQTI